MDAYTAVKKDMENFVAKGRTVKYPFPVEDFALRTFGLDIQYEDFNAVFTISGYDAGDLFGCLFPDKYFFHGFDNIILINSNRKPFILDGKEIPKKYWVEHADRQTIAHEIGHYSDKYVHNKDSQGELFPSIFIADDPVSIIVYPVGAETFANKYSRELFMPDEEVREFINQKGLLGTFDLNAVIHDMRELFGVTQYMVEIRLHELGIHFYNGIYIKKRNRFPYKEYSEESLIALMDIVKKYDMTHPYYDADNFITEYNLKTSETRASGALYYAFVRIINGKYDKKFPRVFEKRVADFVSLDINKMNPISNIDILE
jgi:Zn-dependent peptidase ImmA (M78 family)